MSASRTRRKAAPFQLTKRDNAIVHAVHEHRLLSSDHVVTLLGEGSEQNIKRRLTLLFHNGYLDRIDPKRYLPYEQGSHPMVYGVGNKGADLLADRFGVPRPKSNWTAKNRGVKQRFFEHTLMVSSILVSFMSACRESGRVRFIPWSEILASKCPEATRRKKQPMSWQVSVPGKGVVGVAPDAIFGLHYLDKPEGKNKAFFFLEADRATMPVVRRSFKRSSIYRKLVAYHATAVQKVHTKHFGMKSFRVLTVTESPDGKRVESMVEAVKRLPSMRGVFLFGERTTVEGGVFGGWRDGRGEVGLG